MNNLDPIWNREAMNAGGTKPRDGGLVLAAVRGTHSLIMNDGLLDIVKPKTPEQVSAADADYPWLHLDSVADVIVMARHEQRTGSIDDNAADSPRST